MFYEICVFVFGQYYGNREKLKLVGREHELEAFNRQALKMARQVADATGALVAGNICNTTIFTPDDEALVERCRALFTVRQAVFDICQERQNVVRFAGADRVGSRGRS